MTRGQKGGEGNRQSEQHRRRVTRTVWAVKGACASNRQRVFRVAEVAGFHAHAVHEGDVEAAEFAVFVFAEVVEAAALNGAAATVGTADPELPLIVRVAVP